MYDNSKDIRDKIFHELSSLLGLPLDFNLEIRGYSSTYNGRYEPKTGKVILYSLDEEGKLLPIEKLAYIVIHEAIHHYQWKHDPYFKRVKGVMHNEEFYRLESKYINEYMEVIE